jgi:hypothetical protein
MPRVLCAKRLLLIAAILATSVAHARAQSSAVQTSPGETPDQAIVLPLQLVAGEPATLAVLSPDGRVAAGVKLVLSNGEVVTTDASGRAHFLPPDAGILIARIPGTETRAAADVVPQTNAGKLEIARVPAMAALKDRFPIDGNGFYGDADRNRVEVGGKSAFVLAASPKELVILASPETAPGKAQFDVKAGGGEAPVEITLVDVLADTIQGGVRKGKKEKLVLRVRGTAQPVELDARNLSPKIVQFKHGDRQRVRTQGGADNFATIEVKGQHAGEFSYTVTLEPQPGAANVQAAQDFLEAAKELAAGDEKRGIENILKKLTRKHADIRGARKEFAKLHAANPAGDLQALVRATGKALNGS